MSWRRVTRCGGSETVWRTVSMSQPKTTLRVVQHPSPFESFLTDMGSCRWGGSEASRGRNTESMALKRTRRRRVRRKVPPWAMPMASSTNTSKEPKGLGANPRRRRRRRGGSGTDVHWWLAGGVGLGGSQGGGVSASESRRCGPG